MRVRIEEIKKSLLLIIKKKSSLSDNEAKILADDYIEGELQGKKSHGLAAFTTMIPKLGTKLEKLEILKETDAAIYFDAHARYGALVGREAADLLIKKAEKQGIAMGAVKEMKSWLRPGTIAQYIAEAGLIGLVTNTGGVPMVAPPQGFEPVVGTNPIGIGIPTNDGPLVTDMATSSRAWGEVRLAQATRESLPDNAFLDQTGKVTTDASRAYSAIAFGGYKGFSLALFIELLCGAFAGMPMGKGDKSEDYRTRNRGANIIVIDPSLTIGRDKFAANTKTFTDSIRKTKPIPGKETVTLPGDRSTLTKNKNLKSGYLEVDDETWTEISRVLNSTVSLSSPPQ